MWLLIKFTYPDWLTCKKRLVGGHGKVHHTVTIAYEIITISITKINLADNSYIKLQTGKYNINWWQKYSLLCQWKGMEFHTLYIMLFFNHNLYCVIWLCLRSCPHVSGNFFFRKYFFVDTKVFASTCSVFESFSAVHTYLIVSANFLICSSAQFFCRRES